MRFRPSIALLIVAALGSLGVSCETVSISGLSAGATLSTPQTVTLTAEGDDSVMPYAGSVHRVEFLHGGQVACSDSTSPYSCDWTVTGADDGPHTWQLRVHATTQGGSFSFDSLPVQYNVAIGGGGGGGTPSLIGLIPGSGTAREVLVDGDLAYVTSDEFGLSIFDISDPSAPVGIGAPIPSFQGRDVALSGSLALVTALDGLRVVDVSDPVKPETIGFLAGNMSGVAAAGSFAAVRLGSRLAMVDLRTPQAPSLASELQLPGGDRVEVVGSRAYVTAGSQFQVVDISNPFAPQVLGSVSVPNGAGELAVRGSHAYVGNYFGVHAISIGNPSSPQLVGSASGASLDLAVAGDRLYSAVQADFNVYDLSNPASPTLIGGGEGFGAQGIAAAGDLAFLTSPTSDLNTGQGGFYVVSVAAPTAPSVLAQVPPAVVNRDVAASGSLAVVTAKDGLRVVDISDPTTPETVGFLPGNMRGVSISGSYACVRLGARLATVDLSDKANPVVVSEISLPGGDRVEVIGTRAYVTAGSTLRVFDVGNPLAPVQLGSVSIPGGAMELTVDGDYAYLGNFSYTHVVDVSNPASPTVVGTVTGAASDLAAADGKLYVAAQSAFRVYDVSNPSSPQLLASEAGYGAWAAEVLGDLVFLGTANDGVVVYDVSSPAAPELVMSLQVPGPASSLSKANGRVYVGDGSATLDIFALVP